MIYVGFYFYLFELDCFVKNLIFRWSCMNFFRDLILISGNIVLERVRYEFKVIMSDKKSCKKVLCINIVFKGLKGWNVGEK